MFFGAIRTQKQASLLIGRNILEGWICLVTWWHRIVFFKYSYWSGRISCTPTTSKALVPPFPLMTSVESLALSFELHPGQTSFAFL